MPQPIVPPPASDLGALTFPRQLQRWLDVNRATKLERTSSFITLPAFSQAVDWKGYSELVASFNFEGPNNFSLKSFDGVKGTPNYVLCIMWQDENHVTHRYAAWKDVGEVLYFDVPLYTGQVIKKNFRFEIWSTNSTPAVQSSALTFYTSVKGVYDYRWQNDFTLVSTDGQVSDFTLTSTVYNQPTLPTGSFKSLHFVSTDFVAPDWTTADGQSGTVTSADASTVVLEEGFTAVQVNAPYSSLTGGYISTAVRELYMFVYVGTNQNELLVTDTGPVIIIDDEGTVLKVDGNSLTLNGANKLYFLVFSYLGSNQLFIYAKEWNSAWNNAITIAYTPNNVYTNINILNDTGGSGTASSIIEMVNYYSLTPTEQTQVRDYFLTKYGKFTLPFTFPSNSVPATN